MQVENVMCTTRESLLGSGAWRGDFAGELKARPFYAVTDLPGYQSGARCQACGRQAHNRPNQLVRLASPLQHYITLPHTRTTGPTSWCALPSSRPCLGPI